MLGLVMRWSIFRRKTVIDSNRVEVTLMGTGTSTGVPVIGCACATCTSHNPKDRRLRCSCYVKVGGLHIVIDVGPDFRQQAMKYDVSEVDAALITHHHFDHVVGLDDLRPFLFYNPTSIPCYAHPGSAMELEQMFSYIFRDGKYPGVPRLDMIPIQGPFEVSSRTNEATVPIIPIPIVHGSLDILGFRIGNFAYLTDVSQVPFASRGLLEGLDVLVLDGLREKPHPMHFTIQKSIEVAAEIGAIQTWFTHIAHDLTHEEYQSLMPPGMGPAYDGLSFEASL
jgi:phosphoribosyl 1,2-cyclic phosphate phosphodiesterase